MPLPIGQGGPYRSSGGLYLSMANRLSRRIVSGVKSRCCDSRSYSYWKFIIVLTSLSVGCLISLPIFLAICTLKGSKKDPRCLRSFPNSFLAIEKDRSASSSLYNNAYVGQSRTESGCRTQPSDRRGPASAKNADMIGNGGAIRLLLLVK